MKYSRAAKQSNKKPTDEEIQEAIFGGQENG